MLNLIAEAPLASGPEVRDVLVFGPDPQVQRQAIAEHPLILDVSDWMSLPAWLVMRRSWTA
jgi:hypothetical protein